VDRLSPAHAFPGFSSLQRLRNREATNPGFTSPGCCGVFRVSHPPDAFLLPIPPRPCFRSVTLMGFRSSKVSPSAARPHLSVGLPAWLWLKQSPLRSSGDLTRLPGFALRGSPWHSRRRSPGSARSSLELSPSRGSSTLDGPGRPGRLLPRASRSVGGEPLTFAAPRSLDRGGLELPGRNSAPPGVLHLVPVNRVSVPDRPLFGPQAKSTPATGEGQKVWRNRGIWR
jgi:hypothetical protein